MSERIILDQNHEALRPEYWGGHSFFFDGCEPTSTFLKLKRMPGSMIAATTLDTYFRKLSRDMVERFTIVTSIDPNKYNPGSIVLLGGETLTMNEGGITYSSADFFWGSVVGKEGERCLVTYPMNDKGRASTGLNHNALFFDREIKEEDVFHFEGIPYLRPETIIKVRGLKLCKVEPRHPKRGLRNLNLFRGFGKFGRSHGEQPI